MNMFFPDTPARRVIRLGAAPCRACPASEPCRARAKVGILPSKKNFPVVLWGQLPKVSANLPGRAAPARRHGGHAADVSHQLRSSDREAEVPKRNPQ